MALLSEFGLEAMTMSAVAESADIGTGTLYNYFPSKDALLVGLWAEGTAHLLDQAEAHVTAAGSTPRVQCTALLQLYCQAALVFPRHVARETFAASLAAPPQTVAQCVSLDEQLMAHLGQRLAVWNEEGALALGPDLEAATALLYGIAATTMMWLMTVPTLTLTQAESSIEAQVALVFAGLEASPSRAGRRRKKKQ